jgi:hypothetical protein
MDRQKARARGGVRVAPGGGGDGDAWDIELLLLPDARKVEVRGIVERDPVARAKPAL